MIDDLENLLVKTEMCFETVALIFDNCKQKRDLFLAGWDSKCDTVLLGIGSSFFTRKIMRRMQMYVDKYLTRGVLVAWCAGTDLLRSLFQIWKCFMILNTMEREREDVSILGSML
jgi:hypothetical protein